MVYAFIRIVVDERFNRDDGNLMVVVLVFLMSNQWSFVRCGSRRWK